MKQTKNEIAITLTIIIFALTVLYFLIKETYDCETKKGTLVKVGVIYRCVKLVEP